MGVSRFVARMTSLTLTFTGWGTGVDVRNMFYTTYYTGATVSTRASYCSRMCMLGLVCCTCCWCCALLSICMGCTAAAASLLTCVVHVFATDGSAENRGTAVLS